MTGNDSERPSDKGTELEFEEYVPRTVRAVRICHRDQLGKAFALLLDSRRECLHYRVVTSGLAPQSAFISASHGDGQDKVEIEYLDYLVEEFNYNRVDQVSYRMVKRADLYQQWGPKSH